MMPIAYVFGKGHRMKVLISSSNYDRYQVNPNLPIEAGDFFRRMPGDGQSYTFEGAEMSPRVAEQQVYFTAAYPTSISLPVYDPNRIVGIDEVALLNNQILVYPNPVKDHLYIENDLTQKIQVELSNALGQQLYQTIVDEQAIISCADFQAGIYFLTFKADGQTWRQKVVVW